MALSGTVAFGHGVNYGLLSERAVAVRFGYAGGEPMSYTEVKVFGPQSEPDLEFQNGRTDARGVFAFVPDRHGIWTIEARDESGHRGAFEVPVAQDGTVPVGGTQAVAQGGLATMVKVLLGLSLLCNMALAAATARRRGKGSRA